MRYIITFLIFGLILGCSHKNETITPIQPRVYLPELPISPLLDSLRIPKQDFEIINNQDTLIVCDNGTKIFLNRNIFIDENGNTPDTIKLEIVEVKTISDILRNNLQTVSDNNILQTAGMFFIDANTNGKPLRINDSSAIFIESNSKYLDTRMKLFYGNYEDNGQINWINETHLDKSIIAVPFNLLDYNYCSWECWYSEEQIKELKNEKYKNTYIATREFEIRACAFSYGTCPQTNGLSQKLLDIYKDNINKDLWYSDSLVANFLLNTYSDIIDTTKEFEFNSGGWITYMYESAVSFAKQKLTRPLDFEKLGIDDLITIDDLVSNGYSMTYSQKILAQYQLQKQVVTDLEDKENSNKFASYAFEINQLGWINIDALVRDEQMDNSDFSVIINSEDSLKYISLSLVIPDYNVSVFSIHQDGNKHSFTKKQDGYRKLPIKSNAYIVGFSYKDSSSYFGMKEIKIPESGIIELNMERKSARDIKGEVNKLSN